MTPLAHFIAAIAVGETAVMLPERLAGAPSGAPGERDLERRAVLAAEAAARLEAPGEPPPVDEAVARWAWGVLYHAAALVVHRDLGPEEIPARLGEAPPGAASLAAAAWSADAAFRHLPALHRIAATVSPGDPLAEALRGLGAAWPLSGVGFAPAPAAGDARLAAVLAQPALRRLYVDRVLAAADRERLADPAVAAAARAALGGHAGMLPRAAAALAPAVLAAPAPAASAPVESSA